MPTECKICGRSFKTVTMTHIAPCSEKILEKRFETMEEYDKYETTKNEDAPKKQMKYQDLYDKGFTIRTEEDILKKYDSRHRNRTVMNKNAIHKRVMFEKTSSMSLIDFGQIMGMRDVRVFLNSGRILPARDGRGSETSDHICDTTKRPIYDIFFYFPLTEKEYNTSTIREIKRPQSFDSIEYSPTHPYIGRYPYNRVNW